MYLDSGFYGDIVVVTGVSDSGVYVGIVVVNGVSDSGIYGDIVVVTDVFRLWGLWGYSSSY